MPARTKPPEGEAPPVAEPTPDQEAAAALLEDEAAKRPVIVKLARIMASLPELKPEGRNQHFGYNFIKDTQVSGALRARLARERLMIIPDVQTEEMVEIPTQRGKSYLTKLKIRFTIIDGDSGDSVEGYGIGYGDDSGDKGANKAFTAATKYFLLKLFQVGGEDAEDDAHADLRASARQAGGGAADPVVTTSSVTGVERGGKQNKISKAQMGTLLELYKDLDLTPEGLAERFDTYLGIPLQLEADGDIAQQLNRAVKALSGDEAGEFITKMTEEKDGEADNAVAEATYPDDIGAK